MLINILKSSIREKWKSDPVSVTGTGSPPEINLFFRLVGRITAPSFDEIG